MKFRLALVLALTALFNGRSAAGGSPLLQGAQDPDGVPLFLQRLERIVQAGDTRGYTEMLSQTADRSDATEFTATELLPDATRVVLKERDREALAGTLPGNGYRLSVDVFSEFGKRARSATWSLDIKRVGEGADGGWRIAGQQRLSVVENLYRLALNPAKQYDARDLTISVEDLDLVLAEGAAFVADTDQGTTGLVLLGRGEVRFHPSPDVEKGQLKIFSGTESLQTRFEAVFIRANPEDVATLVAADRLTARAVDQRDFRRAEEVFREELPKSYAVDLSDLSRELWSLLPAGGDLVAEIRTQRYATLTYARSSAEAEDVSFFDRKRHKNICVYASREKLARRGRSYNEDDLAAFDVLDYDIEVAISPDRQWIDGRARIQLRVLGNAVGSLTLRLAETLVVQSIVSDRFGRLPSLRIRNQNTLVVNLPSLVLRDDELTLSVVYAGRLEPQREDAEAGLAGAGQGQGPPPEELVILQPERSFLYSNRSYWYPQATITDYATARLRVQVPAGFDCVASGELGEGFPVLAKDSTPPRKLYEFTTSRPLRYLAFIVSRFARVELGALPAGAAADFSLSVMANPRQVRRGREIGERARDIADFYESILGDYPYPSFTVAVIESDLPGGHSPGYFAALNQPLPTTPLIWRNDPASFDDYPEFFIAHELAHQWWGQAVGWRNYHEQWISEGFSQYFAALYAQHARGDDRFTSMLRQFRRWGIQQSEEGPIYLGYRLGHIRGDSRIFRALVYNKSAAVLHMLRRLVGDDGFFRGVRRFYDSSRFRKVGTDDFRAAMEAETGRPLERFFDRWIYGSTLPRLKFTSRVEAGAEGQNVVLHVEQIGEIFDFPLTVTLQYSDRREVQVLMPVTDRMVEMSVPLNGTLRRVDISRDDGTLADLVKN
jgi:Peptidase family M1 domain